MKCIFYTLLFLSFSALSAQDTARDAVTRPSLFLHFSSMGFKSTKSNSGNSFSDQYSGLGGSYMQGLGKQFDLALSLYGFRVFYPFRTTLDYKKKNTLYELDASMMFRLLPKKHFINPFLSAGVGAYYYVDTYGSFVPLGGGFQFNFKDKFYTALSYQYRVPINAQTEKHYMYTVSAGIPLTKRKPRNANTLASAVTPIYDADFDGLPDSVDACPRQAGPAFNKGCPILSDTLRAPRPLQKIATFQVFFFIGKTAVPDVANDNLDNIVSTLKNNPGQKVQLEGHADDQEFGKKAQSNSRLRAQTVADYLIQNGINKSRITVDGFGTTKPLASNKTLVGRSQNRRVDIIVMGE